MLAHPNIVRTFGYRVVEYTDDFSAFRPPSSSSSFSLNFGDSQEEALNDNRFKMYKVAVMQEQCDIGPLRSVICREGFFERPNISRIDFVGMIAIDICRALMHFENEGMGHNDLSSSNVLLATDPSTPLGMRAKVGDFGLCCPNNRSREVGTIPYMAPELLQVGSKHKGSKTDIYSLGVLMLEMWMGQYAWHPLKPMHIFYNIGLGKRLDVPDDVPEPLSRLVKQCLSDNAEERPSAHDAYEVLCQLTDPSLVLSHQITQCNIQQIKMEVKVSDEKEIIECTQKK
jgi:serine/threonine protein kinase